MKQVSEAEFVEGYCTFLLLTVAAPGEGSVLGIAEEQPCKKLEQEAEAPLAAESENPIYSRQVHHRPPPAAREMAYNCMQSTTRQEVFAKLNADGYPDISSDELMVNLLDQGCHYDELSDMFLHLDHLGVDVDKEATKNRRRRKLEQQASSIDFSDLMYLLPHEVLRDFFQRHDPEEVPYVEYILETNQGRLPEFEQYLHKKYGEAPALETTPAGCTIPDTALRAISLNQLDRVLAHTIGRVEKAPWKVTKYIDGAKIDDYMLSEPEEVTLYDLNSNVVVLATVERQCSMVELLASDAQSPDFFVSHWWGEPVILFLKCLRQHSRDHGLESKKGWYEGEKWDPDSRDAEHKKEPHPGYLGERSPLYWICVHANNRKLPKPLTHCTGSLSLCSLPPCCVSLLCYHSLTERGTQ